MTPIVLAAFPWASNAELVADVARLGYLKRGDTVLDGTYGAGVWWRRWQPDPGQGGALIARTRLTEPEWDFRRMDYRTGTFDAVAFDPPYKMNGTDQGEGARYGVDERMGREDRLALMRDGLAECGRVTKPGGVVLAKCQDQVEGGRMRWQTYMLHEHGLTNGLLLVDQFQHLGHGRPQPARTRKDGQPSTQQHAYSRPSTLMVFRKVRDRSSQ